MLTYRAIRALQSSQHSVVTFTARPSEILTFSEIDRAARGSNGRLRGFQRPQIASHIREIRDYLAQDNAILPNPIVVAFVDHVTITELTPPFVELHIDTADGKPGFVVDGQQRLSAFAGLHSKEFEVFVSALVCENYEELRRQFVLINNTRPLPKGLIYELLPSVTGLPERLSSRATAAALTERLNFDADSSLRGTIYQHTNPQGVIRDNSIQRVILTSASDGVLREFVEGTAGGDRAFRLVSDFFGAVQEVFPSDWHGHTPKTSRLVHGVGVRAMGYVMDLLWEREHAMDRCTFRKGLETLVGHTAWTKGQWRLSQEEVFPWNGLQNIDRHVLGLARYLVGIVKRSTVSAIVNSPQTNEVDR
jgi:DGQHR domain-containing protein